MTSTPSTRKLTQQSGAFTRTTDGSQSLQRGLQLLRAFVSGASTLTNAELAARTGLPRPTISRLTRSLVEQGFLAYERSIRAYRLGPILLTLSQSFVRSRPDLALAQPLMQTLALTERINVNLAESDLDAMTYVESVREDPSPVYVGLVLGTRLPMEKSSVGRAFLAAAAPEVRRRAHDRLAQRYGAGWPSLLAELDADYERVRRDGYTASNLVPGVYALAAPVRKPDGDVMGVNVSFTCWPQDLHKPLEQWLPQRTQWYAPKLLALARELEASWRLGLAE